MAGRVLLQLHWVCADWWVVTERAGRGQQLLTAVSNQQRLVEEVTDRVSHLEQLIAVFGP